MSRFLWTQIEDIGPSARFGHAMTYDTVRSRSILFGGSLLIGGASGSVNDTWEWNGEFWTQMANSGPAARQDHALCFDSVRQTALLFGGLSEQNSPLGDTWSWDGEGWTQLGDSVSKHSRTLPRDKERSLRSNCASALRCKRTWTKFTRT